MFIRSSMCDNMDCISPNSTWLDSTRLDSTRHVRLRRASRASRDERVERDEPCCSNMADVKQAIVFACTSLVVTRFYTLAYTNPVCFVK